ncbi:hypothetical protein M2302_003818 [Micromonospora sp. A200]|uniref:hypothetical protein n=1 Tax=Micromonospora sp. A200 TaxID=2940568 RepID=UPI002474A0A4|nr:hypothetical protein [Micromonospora sp. A200]MDH6463623.1 hypothetical protein [Micromonospora sp. A200]
MIEFGLERIERGMYPYVRVVWGAVGAAVAVATVAGCGPVTDRGDAAAAVTMRMMSAVTAKDGPAACALLAPDTAAELEQSADKPCAEAILEEDLPGPGSVSGSRVYGQWAQVQLSGDMVFLAVFPGGWRVVAVGCTARGDGPYDCVLQGG